MHGRMRVRNAKATTSGGWEYVAVQGRTEAAIGKEDRGKNKRLTGGGQEED